jgi:hypothetical protein
MDHIHQLIGFSMEGKDISKGFQGSGKHRMKKGELNLYDRFGTRRGGYRAVINLVNDEQVCCAYYIIFNKVMNYTKGNA